eukprot:m.95337 g.95337  ORF g.95337 m.95337 type:complete len:118 (-) comp10101_c0_seq3:46-399(-)
MVMVAVHPDADSVNAGVDAMMVLAAVASIGTAVVSAAFCSKWCHKEVRTSHPDPTDDKLSLGHSQAIPAIAAQTATASDPFGNERTRMNPMYVNQAQCLASRPHSLTYRYEFGLKEC